MWASAEPCSAVELDSPAMNNYIIAEYAGMRMRTRLTRACNCGAGWRRRKPRASIAHAHRPGRGEAG